MGQALGQLQQVVSGKSVLVSSDNTTVVAYLNKQGGTHSVPLCLETRKLLLWCQQYAISLKARHIAGKANILADYLSRGHKAVLTEWRLSPEVASAVIRRWGDPWLDLFATCLNSQLRWYVSPVPDARAWAIDAMSFGWNQVDGYAFPPFVLIPLVLRKVRQSVCRVTLIAPYWPTRSWFTNLLDLLVESPVTLPLTPYLLSQHAGRTVHPDVQCLHLHAWRLSGISSERMDFLQRLPRLSHRHDGHQHLHVMRPSGSSGAIGVCRGRLISASLYGTGRRFSFTSVS